ncbi:MAG TPA: hypothetical protein VN962_09740 [Polyangia bacterium]|nr:hypothetical protein [Polyangia bacterium]
MHPAVVVLSLEEQGFVLGTLLARRPAPDAGRLMSGPDARWRAAVEALSALPRPARAAMVAELIGRAQTALPDGLERVHPGWLRERLTAEPSAVIRLVTDGLPVEVRRVAAEVLAERGDSRVALADCPGSGVATLRRAVFAGLLPLAGAGAPAGPEARAFLDLSFAAVEEAVEQRGAATLGTSLRGAPGPVVAQAAAGLGGRLARTLLEAAGQSGAPEARSRARMLVSAAANELSPSLAMRLGLRALALALSEESADAVAAVAQRLPPPLGRRLLALAAAPWD